MCRCLIALLVLIPAAATAAPVWTWVDENGRRHFSDRPVSDATRIELPDAAPSTVPGPRAAARSPAVAASSGAGQTAGESSSRDVTYTRFEILSPSQEQTLWNIGGTLSVQLAVEPELQPNHELDVILDGERVDLGATGTQLTVPEVYRGLHTLQAVIIDAATGREVLRSLTATFAVQQTSLLNPNNPNSNAN